MQINSLDSDVCTNLASVWFLLSFGGFFRCLDSAHLYAGRLPDNSETSWVLAVSGHKRERGALKQMDSNLRSVW